MLVIKMLILFLISCLPNIMLLKSTDSNGDNYYWLNKTFNINVFFPKPKYSEFNFLNPFFVGSLSGGLVLVILIIIIYLCCKDRENQTKQTFKQDLVNSIDISMDKSKTKFFYKNEITKEKIESNCKEQDKSDRILIGSLIEKREQKITLLFDKLSAKLNDQYHSEQDKHEFFKTVKKSSDEVSVNSILSNLMPEQSSMRNKAEATICYTNEKRDSPPESFYAKKIDELNDEESEIGNNYLVGDVEKESNEEETKEVSRKDDKHTLQPDDDDIISDYKEKTKDNKLQIYKQNTQDFEKESLDRFNNELSLRKPNLDNGIFYKIVSKVKKGNDIL